MSLTIVPSGDGFTATEGSRVFQAAELIELIKLLSEAGCHSTDVTDAVDAAGLEWPGGSK